MFAILTELYTGLIILKGGVKFGLEKIIFRVMCPLIRACLLAFRVLSALTVQLSLSSHIRQRECVASMRVAGKIGGCRVDFNFGRCHPSVARRDRVAITLSRFRASGSGHRGISEDRTSVMVRRVDQI